MKRRFTVEFSPRYMVVGLYVDRYVPIYRLYLPFVRFSYRRKDIL